MIKKLASLALIYLLLITANFSVVSAQTKIDEAVSVRSAAKVKAAILERGTGENKRLEVKKLDGTKLKGYVSQADEDSFSLVDSKTKQTVTIAYRDVEKVKNRSSRGDKIALIAIVASAATAAIIVLSFLVIRCQNEGGC